MVTWKLKIEKYSAPDKFIYSQNFDMAIDCNDQDFVICIAFTMILFTRMMV